MKLILELLALFLVLQLASAAKTFGQHDMWWSKKYVEKQHRQPPIEKISKFSWADPSEEDVDEKWIEQRLNNFDPQDNRTFMMRYMENSNYLQDGGPIFIFVGGEWTIDEDTLRYGHMSDMARELNGTMFYPEHRYYGETRPTPDLKMDNLRYLNVDQALADLAHFIVEMKATNPLLTNSGVILVGGSYSATMVTWFMQKYPHLANGAWSSSAPLEAQVDFVEYLEVVSDAIRDLGGANCSRRIESAFQELESLLKEGNSARIEEVFKLCYPFKATDKLDKQNFFSSAGAPFSSIVQYHRDYAQTIQSECNLLENSRFENDLEAYAWWWWFGAFEFDPEEVEDYCFDHRYSLQLYLFGGTEWYELAAFIEFRQWFYQTCAEYGWYQSSGSDDILFGSNFPAELQVQLCKDIYSDV